MFNRQGEAGFDAGGGGLAFTSSQLRFFRVVSFALAFTFVCVLTYTINKDGSPFRGELLTPWMNATLVDFYFNVALLSVWIYLRERSKAVAFFWIMVLVCLGSCGTWFYVWQLSMRLRVGDPLSKLVMGAAAQ